MYLSRPTWTIVLLCLVVTPLLPAFGEGTLQPPPAAFSNGNPKAIMKTLDQVEPRKMIVQLPYTIDAPGSYYVIQPLTGVVSSCGITIATGDVKLDLSGFAITGVSNSSDGIRVTVPCENVTIRNGVVRQWGGFGINATNAKDVVLEQVRALGCDWGGLYTGNNAHIERCMAYGNGANAPVQSPPPNDGIQCGQYSTVIGCKVRGSFGTGIHTYSHSRITGCTSTESQVAEGINAENYCTVKDCTLASNAKNGISIVSFCRVTGNTCGQNGMTPPNGAGIQVFGNNNVIENNNVVGNYWGIKVNGPGQGNLIIRNSASQNSNGNYLPTPNDFLGEIIQPSPGQFTNSNPWANFMIN